MNRIISSVTIQGYRYDAYDITENFLWNHLPSDLHKQKYLKVDGSMIFECGIIIIKTSAL